MRTAAALVIGNELLSGKVEEANVPVLARMLRTLGVELKRVVMVPDDIPTIAREVAALAEAHDWLFTSGGVGPTHDDVTIEGVARAFGTTVILSPVLEKMLRDFYGDRMTDGHALMARVPDGARLVSSKISWPVVTMENVWVLPGVPEIFQAKMTTVLAELSPDRPFVSMSVCTNLDEGQIKALLDRVVVAYGDVDIGSYPKWSDPEYKTKLTFDGLVEERVRAARDAFAAGLPAEAIVRIE